MEINAARRGINAFCLVVCVPSRTNNIRVAMMPNNQTPSSLEGYKTQYTVLSICSSLLFFAQ